MDDPVVLAALIAAGCTVQAVRNPRMKRDDLVRVWAPSGELVAASCREDGRLHSVEDLVTNCYAPGGHSLQCRQHNTAQVTRYNTTPAGRIAQHERNKSGAGKATNRRRLNHNRGRTPEQVAADCARLHPDGAKTCQSCRAVLPLSAFHIATDRGDGLQTKCRRCNTAAAFRNHHRLIVPSMTRRDCWACVYCGEPYEEDDHVQARADEGLDVPENLAPACARCNRSKWDADLFDWDAREHPDLPLRDIVAGWPVIVRQIGL